MYSDDDALKAYERTVREFIDRHELKSAELSARIQELEQLKGKLPMSYATAAKASDLLVSTPEFQAFASKRAGFAGITLPTDTLLPQTKNTVLISDSATNPSQRTGSIAGTPEQRTYLRQLLPTFVATNTTFDYLRQTGSISDWVAAAQWESTDSPAFGEGGLKKQSSLSFENVNEPVATVAHFMKASRQVLTDNAALERFCVNRMRLGVELAMEAQIVSGSGINGEMSGLTDSGNYTAFVPESGDTALDSINRAKAHLEAGNFSAGLVIIHPSTAAAIERTKTQDHAYLIGNPAIGGFPTIWGIPMYRTTAIQAGKFICLDLNAVGLWVREEIDLRLSESDSDNFIRNLITVRAEARAGLGVLLPAGVIYGDAEL